MIEKYMTNRSRKKKEYLIARIKNLLTQCGIKSKTNFHFDTQGKNEYFFDIYIENEKRNIGIILYNPKNELNQSFYDILQNYSDNNNCEVILCQKSSGKNTLLDLMGMINSALNINDENSSESDSSNKTLDIRHEIILKKLELEILKEKNKQTIIEKLL
jgi:hypothetical protein